MTTSTSTSARPAPRPRRRSALTALALAAGTALTLTTLGAPAQAGPARTAAPAPASETAPDFGPNVTVLDPSMAVDDINARLQAVSQFGEFSSDRHAVLFKPGTYGSAAGADDPATATGIVNAEIGYYQSISGLGVDPGDVVINGALHVEPVQRSERPWEAQGPGSLDRFWRSMSNLSINPIQRPVGEDANRTFPEGVADPHQLRWAASQASPLRRVDVDGDLTLFGRFGAYASGGYLGDSTVTGTVVSGSQQQYYVKDSTLGSWEGAVWNMVFSGVQGAPAPSYPPDGHNPDLVAPYTVLPSTPVSRSAPYLTLGADGRYAVVAPKARLGAVGPDRSEGTRIPLSKFYLAHPGDSAATINAALTSGLNLLLTPGIYHLERPIEVTRRNTVVLGMGMATLQPATGRAAIVTGDVAGIQLSGVTVDAGPRRSGVLVQVGPRGGSTADLRNPTTLTDVFVRVGGRVAGSAGTAIEVNSRRTLLDNTWIWRADHGNGVGWTVNPADTGLVVNADDVTATGLFVEHFRKTQTVWRGQRGTTVFYQSELPYDPPSAQQWRDGTRTGFASYQVEPGVRTHTAYGLGVYSFFPDADITATRAVDVPRRDGVRLTHLVTRYLNGRGGIASVVNGTGEPVSAADGQQTSFVTSYP